MNKLYNILWIDDEWDKMPSFMQECEEAYNLKLHPHKTRKAGMEALEKDLKKWHAVLLDAKMFDETENEVARLKGLFNAIKQIERLSTQKALPYFISTGQPDLLDNEEFEEMGGKYYEKGDDDEQLMEDIVAEIEKAESMQVRVIYEIAFHSLESLGISKYTDDVLLDILVPMHFTEKASSFKPVHHYNQLRQLIEYLFRACNKAGLVPDACIPNGIVNLSQSSLYLAGKNAEKIGIRYGEIGERVVPEYIEKIIRSVLEFGNVHSHTVELDCEDIQKIENILRSSQSRYLIFGLALQLCEVIVWLSEYISTHNDTKTNLLKCQILPQSIEDDIDTSEYEGKIFSPEKDPNGVWHCGDCELKITFWNSGRMRLKEVTVNGKWKNNKEYPYRFYAKYEKVE